MKVSIPFSVNQSIEYDFTEELDLNNEIISMIHQKYNIPKDDIIEWCGNYPLTNYLVSFTTEDNTHIHIAFSYSKDMTERKNICCTGSKPTSFDLESVGDSIHSIVLNKIDVIESIRRRTYEFLERRDNIQKKIDEAVKNIR